ncbi:MAG TPA: DUF1611 domain-containing protein [Vicinamibacteria bacterium]|nr:DUF1611 domain-containing protein [Vicinamibacteria bacterium]
MTGSNSFLETPDGNAVLYCEGAFLAPNGKTAHGLVRFSKRYRVTSVIDSTCAGRDAAALLGVEREPVPILAGLSEALAVSDDRGLAASHFVVGLAPDGGRLEPGSRSHIVEAIERGLHVDCGLHDYLTDDEEIVTLARSRNVRIRDVRKSPPVKDLHFFSGKIEDVESLRIAVLGTDSALGKRTAATILTNHYESKGFSAVMIGTGQTAWMQGVRYGIVLDSLVNDFVSGEIEHVVWSAWNEQRPDRIFLEGQGSLLNPAYPGGFEILAAARPHGIVLQHAPARKEYDGFPGYPIQPLITQIEALQIVSGKPVVALSINHENIPRDRLDAVCREIEEETALPAVDVLVHGPDHIMRAIEALAVRASR